MVRTPPDAAETVILNPELLTHAGIQAVDNWSIRVLMPKPYKLCGLNPELKRVLKTKYHA